MEIIDDIIHRFYEQRNDIFLLPKDILGNRAQLSKWQDEFHAHMKKQLPILNPQAW